jgi:hypothetical protein
MLENLAVRIWKNTPKFSIVFWLATALGYLIGVMAIVSFLSADYSHLNTIGAVGERAAFHLSMVRLIFVSIILVVFPILLFTSLRRLFYFMVGITAWVVIIYIDDVLVLYNIMARPQLAMVNIVVTLRPFAIIGLLWMCFELNMRLKNGS